MTANNSKYRTTKDIIIPKGSNVIFVSRMKQEATRKAQALVNLGGGRIYDWMMDFDAALEAGLIEEVK